MAASYWLKQSHTVYTALPAFVRWLVNTTGLWTIVEAYDASATQREVPGDVTDIDTLATAVEWPNGTLTANSWIVLQSTNAGQTCQVYLELESTQTFEYALLPKADFTTGGANISPPLNGTAGYGGVNGFSSTTIGAGAFVSATVGSAIANTSTVGATAFYSAICDAGLINLISDYGSHSTKIIEMGKLLSSHPSDLFPSYINYAAGASISTGPRYGKLSPVDGTTLCTGYDLCPYLPYAGGYSMLNYPEWDGLEGEWLVWPCTYQFTTAGHAHAVQPAYKYWCNTGLAVHGTINDLAYVHFSGAAGYAQTAYAWDGVTAYP